MRPKKCSLCNGRLVKGEDEFVAKVKDEVVSIKNVPAYICEECGESYYTAEVSRRMDEIMEAVYKKKLLAHPIAAGEVDFKRKE